MKLFRSVKPSPPSSKRRQPEEIKLAATASAARDTARWSAEPQCRFYHNRTSLNMWIGQEPQHFTCTLKSNQMMCVLICALMTTVGNSPSETRCLLPFSTRRENSHKVKSFSHVWGHPLSLRTAPTSVRNHAPFWLFRQCIKLSTWMAFFKFRFSWQLVRKGRGLTRIVTFPASTATTINVRHGKRVRSENISWKLKPDMKLYKTPTKVIFCLLHTWNFVIWSKRRTWRREAVGLFANNGNILRTRFSFRKTIAESRAFSAARQHAWSDPLKIYSTKNKNSSMELAVIWGNFSCSDLACSDLACSDLTCSDLAHSDLACSDLAHFDLAHSDLAHFFVKILTFFT